MSMDSFHRNPIEHDESPIEDEHTYPCACGHRECIADDREPGNYKIRGEWYSAHCQTAKYHPDVIGDVLAALHQDEINDDFNERRR